MTFRVRIELPTGGRMTVIRHAGTAAQARARVERDTLPNLPPGSKVLAATRQRP